MKLVSLGNDGISAARLAAFESVLSKRGQRADHYRRIIRD